MNAAEIRTKVAGASDIAGELIHVPEWGCDLAVCPMTGTALGKWQGQHGGDGDPKIDGRFIASLLVHCLRGDDNELVYGEADVEELANKNGVVLMRLFFVAQRVNYLSEAALKDLEKNS